MANFGIILQSGKPLEGALLHAAIRDMIIGEQEACQQYEMILNAIPDTEENAQLRKTITSILNEEKVHIGEFIAVMIKYMPDEFTFYQKGRAEVDGEARQDKK